MRENRVHEVGFFVGREETDELENVVVGSFFDGKERGKLYVEGGHHIADDCLLCVESIDVVLGDGKERYGVRGKVPEESFHVFFHDAPLENGVSFVVEAEGSRGANHAVVFHALQVVDELQGTPCADEHLDTALTCFVDGLACGFGNGMSGEGNECSVNIEEKCFEHEDKGTIFSGLVKNER